MITQKTRYKYLLQGWNNHPNFEFKFDNRSVIVPINSEDAGRVKAGITLKMKEATHLLVIVGKLSHTSDWINWEIEKAKDLGLKLAAVKIDRAYNSPIGLLGVGTSWATSFTEKQITEALNSAVVGYE